MKITTSLENINSFGGLNFISTEFEQLQLPKLITNDYAMTDEEVVFFYNQRGGSERIFDEMNNDFGWGKLPFLFLEENTVYMLITAMCRNFYLYFIDKLCEKIPFLENTFRLKKFIFRFVVVPYK